MAKKKPKKGPSQQNNHGIPPVLYAEIRRRYLFGETLGSIAERLELSYSSLRNYITSKLDPEIRAVGGRHIANIRAELMELKCFAWDQLFAGQNSVEVTKKEGLIDGMLELVEKVIKTAGHRHANTWTGVIQWCIDCEAKLGGHYKSTSDDSRQEFRVAGRSPQQINAAMLKRIHDATREIRERDKNAAKFI